MFRTRAPQTCMYLNLETRLAHLICIIYHTEVKQATSHSNQTEENTIGIQKAVKKSTLKSESMQHKKIKQGIKKMFNHYLKNV